MDCSLSAQLIISSHLFSLFLPLMFLLLDTYVSLLSLLSFFASLPPSLMPTGTILQPEHSVNKLCLFIHSISIYIHISSEAFVSLLAERMGEQSVQGACGMTEIQFPRSWPGLQLHLKPSPARSPFPTLSSLLRQQGPHQESP